MTTSFFKENMDRLLHFCFHTFQWIVLQMIHLRILGQSVFDILYTPYILRGFYFRESGAIREFNNTRKYLPPIPTHECDFFTQYCSTVHSARARQDR